MEYKNLYGKFVPVVAGTKITGFRNSPFGVIIGMKGKTVFGRRTTGEPIVLFDGFGMNPDFAQGWIDCPADWLGDMAELDGVPVDEAEREAKAAAEAEREAEISAIRIRGSGGRQTRSGRISNGGGSPKDYE